MTILKKMTITINGLKLINYREERHPVTPVRPTESFLPYRYDLSPSPLSEVDCEVLFPPLSIRLCTI